MTDSKYQTKVTDKQARRQEQASTAEGSPNTPCKPSTRLDRRGQYVVPNTKQTIQPSTPDDAAVLTKLEDQTKATEEQERGQEQTAAAEGGPNYTMQTNHEAPR